MKELKLLLFLSVNVLVTLINSVTTSAFTPLISRQIKINEETRSMTSIPVSSKNNISAFNRCVKLKNTIDDEQEKEKGVKLALEEKMSSWEASEEEMKAASLGGITPGRTDGFDIGLYIAFPIIVITSLLFAAFPFIMDKIDVASVGPPPTV